MRTSDEVTAGKLRGGFYSPDALVKVCLDRASELLNGDQSLRVLEPSAGDGAFLSGLSRHPLGGRVAQVTAIELLEEEAAACGKRLADAGFAGEVIQGSALRWALENIRPYDLALGNPPFVRFQFVGDEERVNAIALGSKLRAEFKGVANLWLPVLLGALGALRPGGVFAFIIPAESFTGISSHEVREWLLRHVQRIYVDLFPPGSFPSVLQEVVVLSGRITEDDAGATRSIHLREHTSGHVREWQHDVAGSVRTWTRYLLSPAQVASLDAATKLESVVRLGQVSRFEVATVTGANSFFCVDFDMVREFGLHAWARPLLPRTRHAPGLAYTNDDHAAVNRAGLAGCLLDFAAEGPDPMRHSGARAYLAIGEQAGLQKRFKCRIRSPWYRVPVVPPGAMMLAKRSHLYPRVIVNDANVVTTDTIYRGRLLPGAEISPRNFAAAFHNSLTLLTSEIEGRSFGGGVLELVPSEISRLALPLPVNMDDEFDQLDVICRGSVAGMADDLVEETDRRIVHRTKGLTKELMEQLQEARHALTGLRLARN